MTIVEPPICMECKHLLHDEHKWACKAFPDGIPKEIIDSEVDHTRPYPGDHGIRFEPMTLE